MLNKTGTLYYLLIILSSQVYNQTISTVDTIYYNGVSNIIRLRKPFIIESSLQIRGENNEVIPKTIFPIKGEVELDDSLAGQTLIFNYEFLVKGLPIRIGPKWKFLDIINNDKNIFKKSWDANSSSLKIERTNVFSSGSLFRQISLFA